MYTFKENGKVLSIETPLTPRKWMNYLWNEEGYLTGISQVGDGESRYLSSNMDLNQITKDSARYFYIRDDDEKEAWSPCYYPMNIELDSFECNHSLSYTEIISSKNNIKTSIKFVVPQKGLYEMWKVTIENNSYTERKLSFFPLIQWELAGFQHPPYYINGIFTSSSYIEKFNGVYATSENPYAPNKRYKAFLSCNKKVYAGDGFVNGFTGVLNSFARPEALIDGKDCTNSKTITYNYGAVLQNKIILQPGEKTELIYCMGICESLEEAEDITKVVYSEEYFEKSVKQNEDYWNKIINNFYFETPDTKINHIINIWAKKQMVFCKIGKKGVRDNMQIADGLLQIWNEGGYKEIIEVLSHQFKDGHTLLTWYPYDDTHYSDQPIWLVMGVTGYIKETGDFSILEEQVPYEDGGAGTVWEHLKAGLKLKLTDLGVNGLCRLRYADWNDALNCLTDQNAESVFVSMGLGYMLKEMAALAEKIGDIDFSRQCLDDHEALAEKINRVAWDGEYYTMVYHKDGVVGSKDSKGSKVFINPQTWSILGDIVPNERLDAIFHTMDEKMEHEFGLPINVPPYESFCREVGRISAVPAGLFENGGIYCHATGFAIVANAKVGRGDAAYRLLNKIMPDSSWNPVSQSGADPHVFTNCFYLNKMKYGWCYTSWFTGTSVWCFKGLAEWIIGVRRGYDGLIIDPCLPKKWKYVKVKRVFRNCTYNIEIHNPKAKEKGKVKILVDGIQIEGNVLKCYSDDKEHNVNVTIE